ncbi:aldose 1-epimerase [Georgenia sp. TF02-10]|uniref:aldose 1-epimerase n=1 Tax=Georgenia sp. TF02-10 TaxID=2917725 RepID=UPI001FA6E39E|nr:aldose 1-epimerase [Georgenia sp. TF02-10]UNX53633.1 aldose 1-epimerase [Georgenia sp. TF02-10]
MSSTTHLGPTTIERGDLDGEPTWVLTNPAGARLVVAERGATALAWQVPDGAGRADLLDGYPTAAELTELDGYRGSVLAPWSNRIAGARYTFAGVSHDLGVAADGTREALHGLVTGLRWRRSPAADGVLRLTAVVPPDLNPGYPFSVTVTAAYSLGVGAAGESRLGLEITATNTGDGPAPVTLGWHPYLRMPGHDTIDDLELTVPARARVLTDAHLIPLPGEQAYAGVSAPVRLRLAGLVLDQAFTDLVPDDDGVVTSVLRSPATGATLTLEQEPDQARVVHVFTGDPLVRRRRAAVAVEPCQTMADAFNRADCADIVPVEPGQTRQLVTDIVYRRG